MNLNTIKYLIKKPGALVSMLGAKELLNWMPDRLYLSLVFRMNLGYRPDFDDPKTFNEKLNWLKLYDRKPEYTGLVDKYAVREYIGKTIGEDYLIPLVGGPWNSVEEIDFDALPEQFVLKTTHDSGGVVICRDKQNLDVEIARRKLEKHLRRNFFWAGREWPYKNVKPRIIAEKYMEDSSGELKDYKLWCFNGCARICNVCTDRFSDSGVRLNYLDRNWEKLGFERERPSSCDVIEKPEQYELMLNLADKLACGHSFLRTDFYEIQGKIYFGELTFFPGGSFTKFSPVEWDRKLGDWIELPEKTV